MTKPNLDGFAKRSSAEITPKLPSTKDRTERLRDEYHNITSCRDPECEPSFKDKFVINEPEGQD